MKLQNIIISYLLLFSFITILAPVHPFVYQISLGKQTICRDIYAKAEVNIKALLTGKSVLSNKHPALGCSQSHANAAILGAVRLSFWSQVIKCYHT